jgi:putative intracellular protease/amidase
MGLLVASESGDCAVDLRPRRTGRPGWRAGVRHSAASRLCAAALAGGVWGLVSDGHLAQNRSMTGFDDVWARIERHAGQTFTTATGLPFTYRVPGDYIKVIRDGREINRSLSRTNFLKASAAMPAAKPSDIKESQGSAYTWAILMDRRIRGAAW